jgi:protoporphyrinogen oxidase
MFLQHNKASDRAPRGHTLVTLYTDTAATDRYMAMDDARIERWAGEFVESLLPELTGHRDLCEVNRWPSAGYLADRGFWRRARALREALSELQRVQLAGDLFGAGSMEAAIRFGRRAARRVLEIGR